MAPLPSNPPTPLASRDYHFPRREEFMLENGIRVDFIEDRNLPVVSMRIAVVSGVTPEEHGMPGITALTSDMLRKGTANRTADQIGDEIDFLGTDLKISGGKDYTMLGITVLSRFLSKAINLVSDIIMNPVFPDDELAKVIRLETASLANKRTQPSYQARKVYSKVLYGSHPYGDYDTDETVLSKIDRKVLSDFHRNRYSSEKILIVFCGDINAGEAHRITEENFGKWKTSVTVSNYSPEIPAHGVRRVCIVENPNAVQSNIYIGNMAIPEGHPDRISLTVANQVLGGSFASRLFMNLREQKSFTYGAYSRLMSHVHSGILVALAAVRNEVTGEAITEFLNEFRRMREEPVEESELRSAKDYLTGSFPLELERSADIANHVIVQQLHSLPENHWDTYRNRVNSVTPELVMDASTKYIQPDDSIICVVGKPEELTPVLTRYGTIEVYDKTGKRVR